MDCLGLLALSCTATVYFKETFEDEGWIKRWSVSTLQGSEMGRWDWSAGSWWVDDWAERGIMTMDNLKLHAISAKLPRPISNAGKDLVIQFTAKFQEYRPAGFCSGGYIKLLNSKMQPSKFGGETPYEIMFGPDLCGFNVSRIHVIFNHEGESLLKEKDIVLDFSDKTENTHLYTLVIHPNNNYEVYYDMKERARGRMHDDWKFPARSFNDTTDIKPADWVDQVEILDPKDKKPPNWDDVSRQIPDPEARKPAKWIEKVDGVWEPPMILNPGYKGPWKQRRVRNPEYKGPWVPRQVPNPLYKEDVYRYDDLAYVGFELWSVHRGSIFDNIFIGDNLQEAKDFAARTLPNHERQRLAKEEHDKFSKSEEDRQQRKRKRQEQKAREAQRSKERAERLAREQHEEL